MSTNFTPGPWIAEPEEASEGRGIAICAADAIVATILPEDGQADAEDWANANLLAAAPTMRGKLVDTVAWLDREIKGEKNYVKNYMGGRKTFQLEKMEELRDDLAETLRKIMEA